jgi:SWI/SNF-related matrix-associated actin-dependent regulator 1 of chromatin subfamily A
MLLFSTGKTVQAIAAMSKYWREWPLLILTPSSARYHWEIEVRQWLKDEDLKDTKPTTMADDNWDGRRLIAPIKKDDSTKNDKLELKKEAVNVMTSGKSYVLRSDGATKVVIVSYGLIVSLINSGKITPGMFNAIIVDESHALKNKASKRTLAVLPLLKSAERCLMLSGTPALARPSELWPQISVLGGRRKDGQSDDSGIWIDEAAFYSKYVRGEIADENASKAR